MASDNSVATEALIVTVAHRQLVSRFPTCQLSRGDGYASFSLGKDAIKNENEALDVLSKMLVHATRELVGRQSFKSGDCFIDFSTIRDNSSTFTNLFGTCKMPLPSNVETLPETDTEASAMLVFLYQNVVAKENAQLLSVTSFPPCMREGSGVRCDVVVPRCLLVKLTGGTGAAAHLELYSRDFAMILAPFVTSPLEHTLPEVFRNKTFSLDEACEMIDGVVQAIQEYWKASTSTEKNKVNTQSLLAIAGGELREYLKDQLLSESADAAGAWRMPKGIIERAAKAAVRWSEAVQNLTEGGGLAGYDCGAFVDDAFRNFLERLQDVLRIRSVVEHTGSLIGRMDADASPARIFEQVHMLAGVVSNKPAVSNSRSASGASSTAAAQNAGGSAASVAQKKWRECVAKFDSVTGGLESVIVGRLRSAFEPLRAVPNAHAQYALQVVELLRRPTIAAGLESELNFFCETAKQRAAQVAKRYADRKTNATTILTQANAARFAISEIAPVMSTFTTLFGANADAVANRTAGETWTQLQSQRKQFHAALTQTLCDWEGSLPKIVTTATAESIVVLSRRPPAATEDVSTASLPLFFVRLSPEVEKLLTDVDMLRELHPTVNINTQTERTLATLVATRRTALRLMQLASVYDSVDRQSLRCTRGMLRDAVGRCEAALFGSASTANERMMTLTTVSELDVIADRFQASVDALASLNRTVRRCHTELLNTIMHLYGVSLLNNAEQWKATLKELRDMLENFEKTNASMIPNTTTWRAHLDAQLYKVLQYQYRVGLESLHETTTVFKIDITFKQGAITFKPSIEALREQYYGKLKDFVSIPSRFKGVGNSPMFANLASRNGDAVCAVHTKATELFSKMLRVKKQFREHVSIGLCGLNGTWDVDAIVQQCVKTTDDYETSFKMVRERMKRSLLIEDRLVIECFDIGTLPIKAAIDDQLKKLEETIAGNLRRSIQAQLADIDAFVVTASNTIERQPTTLDEVGRANKAYEELQKEMPLVDAKIANLSTVQTVFKSITGTTVDMSLTKTRWEHLKDGMNSHHKHIAESMQKMRGSVDALVQRFMKELNRFAQAWNAHKPKDAAMLKSRADAKEKGLKFVRDKVAEFADLKTNGKELQERCEYFRVSVPELSALDEVDRDLTMHSSMWQEYENFEAALEELRKEDWLTFRSRLYRFEDFIKSWLERAETAMDASGVVTKYLTKALSDWAASTPLLKVVRGEGYLSEHWNEMFRLLALPKETKSDSLTFGQILDQTEFLLAKEMELKSLQARALGEVQIRDALQDIRQWSLDAVFTLIAPTSDNGQASDKPRVMLITEWRDAVTQVSDYQALLASLKDSPHFPRFADECGAWEQKLIMVNEDLGWLNIIQRKWVYLDPIFSRGALPQEQARFKRADKEFVSIMKEVEGDPRLMSLAQHPDYAEKLKSIQEQFDRSQRALNDFLEQKRDRFPRFYFVSDEDLLEILGQSRNPTVIQQHLKKLFMGISAVTFNNDKTAITQMISSEGEVVTLCQPVAITSNEVEDWLISLDDVMRQTLRLLLQRCLGAMTGTLEIKISKAVVDEFPSQILQVASQIIFTKHAEESVTKYTLPSVRSNLQKALDTLTSMPIADSKVRELKSKAFVMDVIHYMEVVDELTAAGTTDLSQWQWKKQLRFYFDPTSLDCSICMTDTTFRYTYEYQGNAPKLVHTPLTDRCYMTLTKGMDLGYGGNLYGPAGTGKTESVKALGGAMGRQVLVFNCDEGIDFKSMGRILIGIVKCGAWGCFDEFNRLKVDQLSAVSQIIQLIQEALKNGEPSCPLLGRTIDVSPSSGIFVTLNPAGKGYGGRSKLPDNLKQLFRAVAMTVPDNELITETMLLSEGFRHAKKLAPKVVECYRLAKQLLSPQQHYDWGLRPLKAVLRLGGSLIQELRRTAGENAERTETQEGELMVQSLRVNTLSKLTSDDARIFNSIIDDIFKGVAVRDVSYEQLSQAVKAAVQALGLQLGAGLIHKCVQLFEALNQRTGVILVGPPGSGKTSLLNVLKKAIQLMEVTVVQHTVNPKAIPRGQLLGFMDPDTREWTDGVLSYASRQVVKENSKTRCWIYCDGDIDPEWVESLNSVLDDNKLLTLPNGVRIQFGGNVNFVFETHNLQFASPATVSRCGIIFLSEEDVDPQHAAISFFSHLPAERLAVLMPWIQQYLNQALDIVVATDQLSVASPRMAVLKSALTYVTNCTTLPAFACELARGMSLFVAPGAQGEVTSAIFQLCGVSPPGAPLLAKIGRSGLETMTVNDAATSITGADLVNAVGLGGLVPLVPTLETQRWLESLQALAEASRSFVVVGPDGCGKNLLVQACFARLSNVKIATLSCSAQTMPAQAIQKLTQLCTLYSTTSGKVLRPKDADRLVLCFKDLNLPKPDKYGTVMLHSFIQQLLLYNGYFDNDLEWVGIEKVQFVATMGAVISAGRYPVTPRLLSLMSVVTVSEADKNSMMNIYGQLFRALLDTEPHKSGGRSFDNGRELAAVVATVYDKIKKRFAGEDYNHCIFSMRDVTNWSLSPLRYDFSRVNSTLSLPEVLAYEAGRIINDRLPRAEDRTKVDRLISEQLASVGYVPPSSTAASADAEKSSGKDAPRQPLFASWPSDWAARVSGGIPTRLLVNVTHDDARKTIEQALVKYSREFTELPITLINELVAWIARIDRALLAGSGHLLLVGKSGVGRRACLVIACYLLGIAAVPFNMGREYTMKQYKVDMKAALTRAVTGNERVALLVEDHVILEESFLELANSLVSSGEPSVVFSQEEIDQLVSGTVRDEMATEGFTGTPQAYVMRRIRANVRFCFIMDPRHHLFGVRCQSNPALLSRCTLLYVDTWSTDGMRQLCHTVLKDTIKGVSSILADKDESSSTRFSVTAELLHLFSSVGSKATPSSLRSLMLAYESIVAAKGKAAQESLKRLESGLSKLAEAEASVDTIRTEVTKKKIEMQKKQEEADQAMKEIEQNMSDSAEQKEKAEELQGKLGEEQKEIAVSSAKIANELGGIQPMLDAAREAVSGIKSDNLNEIKALKAPPEAIRDVLEGVLALLGVQDTSWQSMRKFLGERGVKERIIDFDAKSITPSIREGVERLLQQKPASFKHENIVRASVAAAPLASWVTANVEYASVLERIDPLQRQLQDLEDNRRKGEDRLNKLQAKLKKLDASVEQLRKDFAKRCKEAERLKENLEKAEKQLNAAESLLSKLTSEKERWSLDTTRIRDSLKQVPRMALISAGFITFLTGESEETRGKFVAQWASRLKLEGPANMSTFMRHESQVLKFRREGLPSDGLSTENAIAMLESTFATPLVVDPAGQAANWLQAHFKARDMTVEMTSLHDERFPHTLELAIRFGKTLMVSDIDQIEPLLFPVLRKELMSVGPKRVVQLGIKQVDWQENFRLFLFTRATDLRLPPSAAALVTDVNFSVTKSGLEGQLLGITIRKERPEMEVQKVELLQREEALQVQLAQLEESLLADLANSHGNLLDNTTLVTSLNTIKEQATSIQESLAQSKVLQAELDRGREVFRPLASTGSQVFFLVQDLATMSHMYRYSLSGFLTIFEAAIDAYKSTQDVDAKIQLVSVHLIQQAFLYVSRTLFKVDRVPFGVHVARGLFPNLLPAPHMNIVMGNFAAASASGGSSAHIGVPAWATSKGGNAVAIQDALAALDSIDPQIRPRWQLDDASRWTRWLNAPRPEEMLLHEYRLSEIDCLLITAIFYREKLVAAMTAVTLHLLQLKALCEVSTVASIVSESTADVPILLITSAGADPSLEVQEVAYRTVGRQAFTQIALGGGQTDEAISAVRRCASAGEWLFLKNLHLVLDWANTLEKELSSMPTPHPNFRLWLTSEPHDAFPSVLLKMSLKMTFESPPGAKQNMLRSLSTFTPNRLQELNPNQVQLIYALAWYHSVISERRSYIPQGWVKFYEFTLADLKAASEALIAVSGQKLDWATIRGVVDGAIYGGRLDNDQDMKVMNVFLRQIFSEQTIGAQSSKPLYGTFSVVKGTSDLARLVQGVESGLPDTDTPPMFGLPLNADNVVQDTLARRYLNDLKALALPNASEKKADGLKTLAAPALDAFAQVGLARVALAPSIRIPSNGFPDPIEVFLISELNVIARVIHDVVTFFEHVKKVSDGLVLPSNLLKQLASSLASLTTPELWQDRVPGPDNLFSWLSVLKLKEQTLRVGWMQAAIGQGTAAFLRQPQSLGELVRPQVFLNALRQTSARSSGVALVELQLACLPADVPLQGAQTTLRLKGSGMRIQGATLQGGQLTQVTADAPASTITGIDFVVGFVPQKQMPSQPYVSVPVYTNVSRETFVMSVFFPCAKEEVDGWTLRGVAIFLGE